MRITGLEPARQGHQNLNLARLPIPPYPHNPTQNAVSIKKNNQGNSSPVDKSNERAGIRTPDNLIKSQVLYHLSYTPVKSGLVGFEPTNAGVKVLCLTAWR